MTPVLLRLEALTAAPLSPKTRERVVATGRRIELAEARTLLQREDVRVHRARYVVSGWGCRQRDLSNGRRQIISLILPGDGMGVCPVPQPIAKSCIMTLTRMELAAADDLAGELVQRELPELERAQREAGDEDERRLIDHVVRLGRQSAFERLGHLLLELNERLADVGLSRRGAFALPLTQEVLADVLGLSVVHLNRTLTEMRREGVLTLDRGLATLSDPQALASRVDYRSASLAKRSAPAAGAA